jgi:hypothetical protein
MKRNYYLFVCLALIFLRLISNDAHMTDVGAIALSIGMLTASSYCLVLRVRDIGYKSAWGPTLACFIPLAWFFIAWQPTGSRGPARA